VAISPHIRGKDSLAGEKKHKEIRNCYCIAAAETIIMIILQGTNISHALLKMIFLLPRWDMLIPRRVSIHFSYICCFFLDFLHRGKTRFAHLRSTTSNGPEKTQKHVGRLNNLEIN